MTNQYQAHLGMLLSQSFLNTNIKTISYKDKDNA